MEPRHHRAHRPRLQRIVAELRHRDCRRGFLTGLGLGAALAVALCGLLSPHSDPGQASIAAVRR